MALYQNILSGKVDYPRHVSRQARDLISKLLTADLTRRLGTLRHGSKDIRRHPWYVRACPPPTEVVAQHSTASICGAYAQRSAVGQ